MEESTAIWLLGLAHAQCEALQIEIDDAREASKRRHETGQTLKAERDALREELDALRAAAPAPTGWIKVGDWTYVHPDGRAVRLSPKGYWYADDFAERWAGSTAAEVARAAGWHDFPGAA